MEQWSGNILPMIATFIVGLIVGITAIKAFHSDVKKQRRLEKELKDTKAQINKQKQQIEQHFEQSAQLLATIADDYKKLYSHLAQSSENLLPDAEKIEFFQQAKIENKLEKTEDDQPRDYSEGSSGLLKS